MSHGNPYKIPTFSLPNFNKNFDKHKGIINHDLNDEFQDALKVFISNL